MKPKSTVKSNPKINSEAEMLSLLRAAKEINVSGAPPTHPPPTAFTIDSTRSEAYFSCSVQVLRRDSISASLLIRASLSMGLRNDLFGKTIRNALKVGFSVLPPLRK